MKHVDGNHYRRISQLEFFFDFLNDNGFHLITQAKWAAREIMNIDEYVKNKMELFHEIVMADM